MDKERSHHVAVRCGPEVLCGDARSPSAAAGRSRHPIYGPQGEGCQERGEWGKETEISGKFVGRAVMESRVPHARNLIPHADQRCARTKEDGGGLQPGSPDNPTVHGRECSSAQSRCSFPLANISMKYRHVGSPARWVGWKMGRVCGYSIRLRRGQHSKVDVYEGAGSEVLFLGHSLDTYAYGLLLTKYDRSG